MGKKKIKEKPQDYLVSPGNMLFIITNETEDYYICRKCVYIPKVWVFQGKWTKHSTICS